MNSKNLIFAFSSLLLFAPLVIADNEDSKEKQDDKVANAALKPLKILETEALSPAHYAILLGGKLLTNDADKAVDPTTGPAKATSPAKAKSPTVDSPQVKRVWKHKLPLYAQKVIDMGFDLPNPYGFAGIFNTTKQQITLSDLSVYIGPDPNAPKTPVPFVTFGQVNTKAHAWEAKLDAWLLPFLNAFIISGRVDGSAVIPINVPGEDALKVLFPTLGALCDKPPGFPGRPEACDKDYVLIDESTYVGTNYGFGITLAAGWKNYFIAIPVSYVWSKLSNTRTRVTALDASGRIGYSFHPKGTGMLSVYTGATYLNTKQSIEGTFVFDTGNPDIGEIDFQYEITEQGTEPWNYLAGFNWTLTPNWWVQAEYGFGGKRSGLVASLSYRW